jgi:hypothetical protein
MKRLLLAAAIAAALPAIANAQSCTDPEVLNSVRSQAAARYLDDTALRANWSHIHDMHAPQSVLDTDPTFRCFGVLGLNPVYYGWKMFNGRLYVVWRLTASPY